MKRKITHTEAEGKVLAHVATNLRRFRLATDLSQVALAAKSGISRRMIINLESGDTNISLAKLVTLSLALDVEFSAMIADPAASTQRVQEVA